MKRPADAVSAKLTHDPVIIGLGQLLNGSRNVGKKISGDRLLNSPVQALFCDFNETFDFGSNLAHGDSHGRIAVIPIVDDAKVEADDISLFQHTFRRGDTMNDLLINGNAEARGKPAITFECRL